MKVCIIATRASLLLLLSSVKLSCSNELNDSVGGREHIDEEKQDEEDYHAGYLKGSAGGKELGDDERKEEDDNQAGDSFLEDQNADFFLDSGSFLDLEQVEQDVSTNAYVGLPQPIPEFVWDKIPVGIHYSFFPLEPCDKEAFEDYEAPVTTIDMIDQYFEDNVGSVDEALDKYQPSTVVIIGGSSGIGRANACYWAERGKKVLSLGARPVDLIGKNQPSKVKCKAANRIINVQYDITKPASEQPKPLSRILKEHDIDQIDYLLLGAGRAIFGALRDTSSEDMARALWANVFGLHQAWLQLRRYLNPDLAVVFGISSQMAENQYLALAQIYSLSKRMLYDLMLGYAMEEEFVQPNTHYAAILEGSAASSVGLNYIGPELTKCTLEYSEMAISSNAMWQFEGLRINKIAEQYHKGYARIAAASDLNAPREEIPQSFTFQNATSFMQTEVLQFNNREFRPEVRNACYAKGWDKATEYVKRGCRDDKKELPLCPIPADLLIPFLDPRVPLKCGAS